MALLYCVYANCVRYWLILKALESKLRAVGNPSELSLPMATGLPGLLCSSFAKHIRCLVATVLVTAHIALPQTHIIPQVRESTQPTFTLVPSFGGAPNVVVTWVGGETHALNHACLGNRAEHAGSTARLPLGWPNTGFDDCLCNLVRSPSNLVGHFA